MAIDLIEFYEEQMSQWPLAAKNLASLKDVRKKYFDFKGFPGYIQFNPTRAVSTLAKVDKETIKKRKCFLCKENRPTEQKKIEIVKGWDLLVNPFPILPYHFTIVSQSHIQQKLNLELGKELAKILSGMVIFYNDENAGASAPDHCHFQAVRFQDLPFISQLSDHYKETNSFQFPFRILTGKKEIMNDLNPKNVYFFKNDPTGEICHIAIPRKAHRPSLYYFSPPLRRAVSPGAIDMAGILVTPVLEDFESFSNEDVETIYKEVSFENE